MKRQTQHVAIERVDVPVAGRADVAALVLSSVPAAAAPRWLWLLHGRYASAESLRPLLAAIDTAMRRGALPAFVVVAPDGPWCARAGWWVDSAYDGAFPIESVLLGPVRAALEARFGPSPERGRHIVGGISMGGAAALRWAVVHRSLFGAALLLSPAAYADGPPPTSSARTSGAFGDGTRLFSADRYARRMDYRTLLAQRPEEGKSTRVVTIVGDAEPVQSAGERCYDLDLEAARLHAALKRRSDFMPSLRVVGGGHDDDVWVGAVVEGLRLLTRP